MLDYDTRNTLGEFESQFFIDVKSQYKDLMFLMPNGLMISLRVSVSLTFADAKNQLWKQAENLPGYETLYKPNRYALNCYNSRLEKEEIFDETIRLHEFKIFRSILLVVEKIGDEDEKVFNKRVGSIICLPIFKIQNMKEKEEKDFRRKIHHMCEEVVKERKNEEIVQRMEEVFPPDMVPGRIPIDILENPAKIKFRVYLGRFAKPSRYLDEVIDVELEYSPSEIIQLALTRWLDLNEISHGECDPELYFLKVSGKEEYLFGDCQIVYFKHVQKCICDRQWVNVILIRRASLKDVLADKGFQRCSKMRALERESDSINLKTRDLWDIEGKFSITVGKATDVLGEEGTHYFVKLCLYHGGESLAVPLKTESMRNPEWNSKLVFSIDIADLPRNVRLCCVLFSTKRRRTQSIAWANIPLFDYMGMLKCNEVKLRMWDCQQDDETFNYIGTTTSNTKDECITLSLLFPSNLTNVKYPDMSRICELSAILTKEAFEESEKMINSHGIEKVRANDQIIFGMSLVTDPPQSYIQSLRRTVDKDPLEDIFEQEKTLLWQMRVYCQTNLKNSLPKLLRSFDWSDHNKVAIMKQMVKSWQPLDPEYALELLDYQYPDMNVRDFAVQCLETLTNAQLGSYLLQLVQVLKYESYLDNSLTQFLLKRAIKNSRIGHDFFWHLRSEMHQKELITRFGLILEAYCRANVARTEQIWAQHQALELFNDASKKAKQETHFNNEGPNSDSHILTDVRQILSKGHTTLLPYQAISNSSIKIRKLIIDKCRVMDSKKKPLWLTCENHDDLGDNFIEMYKAGDDLRQDSLTLQTIALMDQLWRDENMDLKLNIYGCMSTGEDMGVISPVRDSITLSKIQQKYGGAFNNETLFKWLKDENKDEKELEEAIANFTLSCAGYCVATYVLGIGDRHSSNIMITKTGKLFHIDFGHFLGNYKDFKIKGIGVYKRERVPMIMLSDFITVITKGKHSKFGDKVVDDPLFAMFLRTCVKAFIVIRNKSTLFINLFALMCSSGIPELRNLEDIRYLKNALSLDDSEEVAANNFKKKLFEALRKENAAKLNFWWHNMAHR